MTEPSPKISCLMVTRGELFPSVFAIQCFRRQTHAHRELVIVCDRPESKLPALLRRINDPKIRYVAAAPATLGALRNLSVESATGDYLCQWDDDDLYHPNRLEVQLATLLKAGTVAHFLSQWIVWWPARRMLALSRKRVWEGTMLIRRGILAPYPELALGEDTDVVDALRKQHQVAISAAAYLYCYIIHGRNSWHEAHFEPMFTTAVKVSTDDQYLKDLKQMAAAMPVEQYAAQWKALQQQAMQQAS